MKVTTAWIDRHAAMADPPRQRRREGRIWDQEQVRLFLGKAKQTSRYYPFYLTAILTGMRAGELTGLRWQDVDLAAETLEVRVTLYRLAGRKAEGIKGQILIQPPKTEAGQRPLPLAPIVVEALRQLQDEQREARAFFGQDYQDHGLVFCQPNGKPLHAHNISQRDFQRVAREAKLPRIRFHDLRHCAASYGALAGIPAKVMQEMLGHVSPSFTMRVYQHTLADHRQAAARTLEAFVMGTAERDDR